LKLNFKLIIACFVTELEAYSSVVSALRAQGELNTSKKKLLQDLCQLLRFALFALSFTLLNWISLIWILFTTFEYKTLD